MGLFFSISSRHAGALVVFPWFVVQVLEYHARNFNETEDLIVG